MFCWGLREVTAPCWSRRLEGLGFGIHQLRNRCSPHGRRPVPTPATWTCRWGPWCLLGAPSLPRKGWGASIATAADPTGRRLFGGRYPRAALRWPWAIFLSPLRGERPFGTPEVDSRRRSSDCGAAGRTRSEANSGRGRVLWLGRRAENGRAEGPDAAAGAGEGQNARSGFGWPGTPEFGLRSGRKDA